MLAELTIRNLAIIDSLHLQFGRGFNALTGETGTGKSIIVDAVSLLVGARASADLVRTGADRAIVEGVFDLDPTVAERMEPALRDLGIEMEGGELIVRREVAREGRSTSRVNGAAVPLTCLREIGQYLIDIHGQGDYLSLLQVRNHLDFLDRYGGLLEMREGFAGIYRRWRDVRRELDALRQGTRAAAQRADLLAYQVNEIQAAALRPSEEEELRRDRTLLANAEKLMQWAGAAYDLLVQGQRGQRPVVDLLAEVAENLGGLAGVDASLQEHRQIAEDALYQMEELGRTLRHYVEGIEYDPERLKVVEERIDLINRLKGKYGDTVEQVLAFAERAAAELEGIAHSDERAAELEAAEQSLLQEMATAGAALSDARREAATRLAECIEKELGDLNMARARFLVDIRRQEDADGLALDGGHYAVDATGLDRVEFMIAPNPGEEPKPLVKIASGGETSRLMLAMRNALAASDPVPVLIFDEIDAGIGGRTGAIVGGKLWALSRRHQVFCVTHLAQMACYADRHFRVVKQVTGARTQSSVQALSDDERVEELAVMLGGAATEATRRSAAELMARCRLGSPVAG